MRSSKEESQITDAAKMLFYLINWGELNISG